jgi:hypothetical protein
VKTLCSVTKYGRDFNMDYPNETDNLVDNTDNPLSQENQEAAIERENQACAETSAKKLIDYVLKQANFTDAIIGLIRHLYDVYNRYEGDKLIGTDIVKQYIGDDIYTIQSTHDRTTGENILYKTSNITKPRSVTKRNLNANTSPLRDNLTEQLTNLLKSDLSKCPLVLCRYIEYDENCTTYNKLKNNNTGGKKTYKKKPRKNAKQKKTRKLNLKKYTRKYRK